MRKVPDGRADPRREGTALGDWLAESVPVNAQELPGKPRPARTFAEQFSELAARELDRGDDHGMDAGRFSHHDFHIAR